MSYECGYCGHDYDIEPSGACDELDHWKHFALKVTAKLETHDDVRDKLDVAEWLSKHTKVKSYDCHACRRHYEVPRHLNTITCVCGHRARIRHIGGIDPDQDVIDAARVYFGNERSAQLAWIAEVVGGQHCEHYTADEIRKMIRQEMDRWYLGKDGWHKVEKDKP